MRSTHLAKVIQPALTFQILIHSFIVFCLGLQCTSCHGHKSGSKPVSIGFVNVHWIERMILCKEWMQFASTKIKEYQVEVFLSFPDLPFGSKDCLLSIQWVHAGVGLVKRILAHGGVPSIQWPWWCDPNPDLWECKRRIFILEFWLKLVSLYFFRRFGWAHIQVVWCPTTTGSLVPIFCIHCEVVGKIEAMALQEPSILGPKVDKSWILFPEYPRRGIIVLVMKYSDWIYSYSFF